MQDNEKKPALRFKGFTDPWEQRKLKELYFQLTERNTDLLPYQKTLSVATMSFKTDGNGAADTSLANYKRLRTGDIAFEGHTSKEFRYGRFVLNDVGDGIMSPRFSALRPLHEMPINFWKYYIHYEPIMRKVLVNSTKAGTMMNELVINDFLQGSILVPSMAEQQAIGRFFKQLDTLITLHQRKYEKLVNIKKSMLDKMFPQNGASVPEIRFKGFTDPWEQRKVGTLIEDYTEKTVTQNQYPVLTSSQQQGIVLQEDYFADRQVTTDNNVGYYVLPKGYFTYRSRSDTDVFVFNRNNIVDKGIISYYYPVFAPKSCDSNFLLRRLNHGIKKQLSMAAEGTGQKVLAHAKFKNMAVDVPSQSEQEKIGTILEELDTLITLHQREHIKPILEVKRVKRNE